MLYIILIEDTYEYIRGFLFFPFFHLTLLLWSAGIVFTPVRDINCLGEKAVN